MAVRPEGARPRPARGGVAVARPIAIGTRLAAIRASSQAEYRLSTGRMPPLAAHSGIIYLPG